MLILVWDFGLANRFPKIPHRNEHFFFAFFKKRSRLFSLFLKSFQNVLISVLDFGLANRFLKIPHRNEHFLNRNKKTREKTRVRGKKRRGSTRVFFASFNPGQNRDSRLSRVFFQLTKKDASRDAKKDAASFLKKDAKIDAASFLGSLLEHLTNFHY